MSIVQNRYEHAGTTPPLGVAVDASPRALVLDATKVEIGPQMLSWRILLAKTTLHVDSQDALWMETEP